MPSVSVLGSEHITSERSSEFRSHAATVTFLFTDIEGSTRLWEREPERMRLALARHDAITRTAVECHRGTVMKVTGDGWKRIGWMTLEVCAGLATLSNEWDRAARRFGAAEAQMKQMGFHRVPPDEAFLAPLIAKARETLGENAFAAAESAGRSLSYEAAMSEAREWLDGHS